jgi:hypothetical protein
MSQRQKYLTLLSEIVPAGLVGVSVLLGSVAERLTAIRDAVSVLTEEAGHEASPADGIARLAWGNWWRNGGWYRPWRGWGWPNWRNWHNWPNWNNWWRNW